jgi:c-di-GMP-binding flagellar brake protein YcgR
MSPSHQDRRKHERFKVRVPIEFHPEGSRKLRSATADLSLGGCYLEMMFTFPIGTILEVSLQIGYTVRAKAIVVTRELQVGNGIQFIDMAPMDRDAIRNYMDNAIKP